MVEARYHCVIDLETTGLSPIRHEIIQMARVVVDTLDRRIIPELTLSRYVRPIYWDKRSKEAMEVNKISKRVLNMEGFTLSDALGELMRGVDWSQTVLASWGTDFELKFLEAAHNRTNRVCPYPYQSFDIRSAVQYERMRRRLTEYLSLGKSCEYFGVDYDPNLAHDALYDAQVTANLEVTLLQGSE